MDQNSIPQRGYTLDIKRADGRSIQALATSKYYHALESWASICEQLGVGDFVSMTQWEPNGKFRELYGFLRQSKRAMGLI